MTVRRALLWGLAVAAVSAALPAEPMATPASAEDVLPPNVLIIVTDDQRARGTLAVMPETRTWFVDGGTKFTRAFATTPICCPSRASVFTGRYAHNHGVKQNKDASELDHGTTIQRHLQERGYRTAIAGKFLNRWNLEEDPPYFHRWAIMSGGYYGARFNVDGTEQVVDDYSTDFIGDRAVEFLEGFEENGSLPWFLYVAPFAPHRPWVAGPGDEHAAVGPWKGNPAVREEDRSDKPPQVRNQKATLKDGRQVRRRQLRTLLSVDRLVGRLFETLERTGGADDTVALFLSDNGFLWGEHGLIGKGHPYRQSVAIPLLLRWPGHVPSGLKDGRLAATIDVAPTVLDAVDIPLPLPLGEDLPEMDGRSLLAEDGRDRLLMERWGRRWATLWTNRYRYTEYFRKGEPGIEFREHYRLKKDPWELTNLFHDGKPGNDPDKRTLHASLLALRRCHGTTGPKACP